MLDKQDLQAIKELIDNSVNSAVTSSEQRMMSYMDNSISASEERMLGEIHASENRMRNEIRASEGRTHAYIESAIVPQFQLLAEGQQTILETLAPKSRVEALEDEVVFLKSVVKALAQDVAELKKA